MIRYCRRAMAEVDAEQLGGAVMGQLADLFGEEPGAKVKRAS